MGRVPLVLPRSALPVLDRWQLELTGTAPPSFPGWVPEGPGRTPLEATPLIAYLRDHAVCGEPFTFNALHLEPQGGRSYPFFLSDYDGPITVSSNRYEAAAMRGPRLLLAAIRRDVRALFQAPPGWSLLELDFKSCHPAIGLALSGDEQLERDLSGDIHQLIGDAVAPQRAQPDRRTLGKRLNNAMLFGLSSYGARDLSIEVLGRPPLDGTGQGLWSAWWARYPRLAAFRDEVIALVRTVQLEGFALEIVAPSGRRSRFSPAEVRGEVAKGRPAHGPDGAWRTVFSACFRAVEGDVLNQTLRHLHANDGGARPALPLYDGLIVAAPTGAEEAAQRALLAAAERAVLDLGIPMLRAEIKQRASKAAIHPQL
ncbi:MAG: hypothetical protein HYV07_31195 [Deltaproteobacteria bacterium]|nr:hypothetical protein [Deltaproteobacteria bacterium]